jgi:TPP-dependent pyruvate/acetoin dehydrogenase alpha subunit
MVPIGVGMAMAEKAKGTQAVVVNFMGDGTLGQGVVYEAANMAALWRLPVVFCIENNRYQQAVPVERAVAGDLVARGRAFGLETAHIDGNDVLEVTKRMGPIIARTRRESLPHWVVFETYRLSGHSKSDDCSYRDPKEEEAWRAKDPLTRLASLLDPDDIERVTTAVRAHLEANEASVLGDAGTGP